MIILITGAAHTGKTVWAQKLMEKYKIPYLSVDHLTHYDDIVVHACDIEQRLCDRVTEEELILENRRFLEGFRACGFDCEIIDEEYPEIDA